MELLFLGSGTSAGIPMIGCHCPVCSSSDPHDKRTRPSVVISYDGIRVLVDTTPELRLQCVNNGVDSVEAIVFTHAHADHIMGLDDVRRFNLVRNMAALDVWADAATHEMISLRFDYAFVPEGSEFEIVAAVFDAADDRGAVSNRIKDVDSHSHGSWRYSGAGFSN